jgi:shikimate kinase
MKIFLVGMPGSGKSTLGMELANSLQLPFIDLDKGIEKSNESTIAEIFDKEGEDAFRQKEKDALERMIHETPAFVMATGGGSPCFFDNMELMISAGLTVFIDVSSNELHRRLQQGKGVESRPLLSKMNPSSMNKELADKRINRLPFYAKSQITVQGDTISSKELLGAITDFPG